MQRLSRRSLLKGTTATAALLTMGQIAPVRRMYAQSPRYEIVSFGPVTEGALAEGDFVPVYGGIVGIHAGGMAFGNIATSPEKLSPALFNADGAVVKLKSGAFGGGALAVNSSGVAAGYTNEGINGKVGEGGAGRVPAIWIDGELTRLPMPDREVEWQSLGGSASGVSQDGAVLGTANGHDVLWVNGEPTILAPEDSRGRGLDYYDLLPDGRIMGRASEYIDRRWIYTTGMIENGEISPFNLPDEVADRSILAEKSNSANEIMVRFRPTDLTLSLIIAEGEESITMDHRSEGIDFSPAGFNADHLVVGTMQERAGADFAPVIWQEGEFTPLESVLPANHGFHMITATGISDDGVISGSGYDEDGGFHPLLFIPA